MNVSEYVHRGRRLAPVPGTGQVIAGTLWFAACDADTGAMLGDDYALCGTCNALCDVGGELREHANMHMAERLDP